ncbi:EF-hand domain-containing protein D1-like [Xiphophorus maculatus]|uniref:EF-hand domain family, member D1 n=1 Tax=Xiphophorus maculatus TaxID=8083 RepID=M4ACH4_XIPMA|nr:EF-hand domain-containing protein D1-like [Xiphophorus maculatus]XP_027900696.1 EF-hand domain-containing protein D1-like [Xiphophorus couchianus]XP_032401025.1 EF-hand domain-containing protein D1-like [Xiphophorus hellerii]
MASEELAKKLQSRLAAAEEAEERPETEQSPVPVQSEEPEHGCGDTPSELATKLNRRLDINDGNAPSRASRVFNPYTEFKEFSRKQIKDMEAMFKRFDTGKDGFIDLMELKILMEKLGAPQTHLGLKNMIKEVDEDFDGKLSFREFLLIFRRAAAGELQEESGLMALARLSEINVSTEGVMGAKDFFEAKVQALSQSSKFEAEIREEKEERKKQEVEKKERQAAFKQLQSAFYS